MLSRTFTAPQVPIFLGPATLVHDSSAVATASAHEISPAGLDLVITLCAEEVCPIMQVMTKKLHWPLPDPASVTEEGEPKMQKFREIRDEIQDRLARLKTELKL
jgi:arsenate reductase